MRTWIITALAFTAACTTPVTDETDDTSVDTDTDAVEETDDTDTVEETDDTDSTVEETDETDETDEPADDCTLHTLPTVTQATGEPTEGQIVVYKRWVEMCTTPTTLSGVWQLQTTNPAGEALCSFTVDMASTTADATCTDCDAAFSGVTWTNASFSDTTLCALFGYDAAFVTGLNSAYTRMGTTDDPDILFYGEGGWEALDADLTSVRTRASYPNGDLTSVAFTFSYGW